MSYLVLVNVFILLMILNENISTKKTSKVKFIFAFLHLLVNGAVFYLEDMFKNTDYFNVAYYLLIISTLSILIYQIYVTYRISSLKNDYNQLFIKSLKEIEKNVYLVTNEFDKVQEISKSFLTDIGLTEGEVINRKWMDIVHSTLTFNVMNGRSIDNNGIEQYYLKYNATYKSQKSKPVELEYVSNEGKVQIIRGIEKPIIIDDKFRGRILVGEKKSLDFMTKSEKDLEEVKISYKDLQQRFQNTIQLMKDGVFYLNESSKEIWGTDQFRKLLGFPTNTIKESDHIKIIHPNDLDEYKKQMMIKERKGSYRLHYRVVINNNEKWVFEEGKTIDTEEGKMTVAVVRDGDTRRKANQIVFQDDKDYKLKIRNLIKSEKEFWIVRFNIDDRNRMNVRYGRDVATHAVNEFLRKLKKRYNHEKSTIFELSPLEYAVVMQNPDEFMILKKGLLSSQDLFRYEEQMGGLEVTFTPSIGIVEFPKNEKEYDELVNSAEKAVTMAGKELTRYHYCFYEDIVDVFK